MTGSAAPKDPEKARPFFYILKDKDIFGERQKDGTGIQFIYESDGPVTRPGCRITAFRNMEIRRSPFSRKANAYICTETKPYMAHQGNPLSSEAVHRIFQQVS